LICFEYAQVEVGGDVQGSFLVSASPRSLFNKALTSAHLPLAPED
jgi:hypothetical protein